MALFVAGSIRERTPFLSVSIQTESMLVAIPPSLLAGAKGRVALTLFVFVSMRDIVLSPQFGTQILPKPQASPEHGRLPTSTAATTVLVFTSRRWTVFFGPFVTQTASSVRTCQSGVPSTGKMATGVTTDIWR